MYAIIEEGGRQFKVTSGDVIRIRPAVRREHEET
jgi:ribosomal protein L21